MKPQHWRLLICTGGSIVVGVIAVLAGAGVVESTLLALVCNVMVLQIVELERGETALEELRVDFTIAHALNSSPNSAQTRSLLDAVGDVETSGYPLFVRWSADTLAQWAVAMQSVASGHLKIADEAEIQERGRWLLQNLTSELFATTLVAIKGFWTEQKGPDYHRANIERAANKKVRITRVFMFPQRDDITDPKYDAMLKTLREQSEAGVEVCIAVTSELPPRANRDFGIWDNRMVCYLTADESSGARVTRADYYTDDLHVQEAQRLRETILNASVPLVDVLPNVELTRSAAVMRSYADDYCLGSPYVAGNGCRWYHSAWQVLRLLDLVETPRTHGEFFDHYLRLLFASASKPLNVLICGLADYEMLRTVVSAMRDAGKSSPAEATIRVIDVCQTPLRIGEWYTQQHPQMPHVIASVARAEDTHLRDACVDLIVTDAFLSKVSYDLQGQVVREWRRILKSGGEVITTIKVAEDGEEGVTAADEPQVAAYVAKAARAAARGDVDLAVGLDEVRELAEAYARNNTSFPVGVRAGLARLFDGFTVEVVGRITVEEYTLSHYAQVVAVKL